MQTVMKLFRQEPLTLDLTDFLSLLKNKGKWKRILSEVVSDLEIAAISDNVLEMGGPALLFENEKRFINACCCQYYGNDGKWCMEYGIRETSRIGGFRIKISTSSANETNKRI